MHPKRSLEWQSCKPPGSPPPPPALALDGLSAPALASLKAAWWTKRLLTSYAGTLYDATHLYDQSGNGKTITSGAAVGTAPEGADTALVFDASVPNTFIRSDALGLAADPALTLVLRFRDTAGYSAPVTAEIFCCGTAGNPELNLYYSRDNTDKDTISLSDTSSALFQSWATAIGAHTLEGWHNLTTTKPGGTGFPGSRLYVDAAELPQISSGAGSIALGADRLILGDFDGGGFPWGGNLAGMLVFERELTGADLALVQAL